MPKNKKKEPKSPKPGVGKGGDLPDLDSLVKKWAFLLRLQDWEITVEWAHTVEMKEHGQGDCTWWEDARKARIRVAYPDEWPAGAMNDLSLQELIIHEMLHVKFVGLGIPCDGHLALIEHQIINDLSATLDFLDVLASGLTKKQLDEIGERYGITRS